ncbi:MAG: GxxExxY protein [Kiritimatiellae bacterium]|nr:GxxExxY protein [Kiritimatiellia bacterium]
MQNDMIYKDEVYAIQGAIFDVYKEMGNLWQEEVYQQCLEIEFSKRSIPYEAQQPLRIFYKDEPIEKVYIPDLWCYGKIIVELKAVTKLADEHRRQILNYLRITKSRLGLLVNFGSYPRVEIERFAF